MSKSTTTGGGEAVTILYTNWRGGTAVRRIVPGSEHEGLTALWFGETEWHPEKQWLLAARDVEKGVHRVFALSGIRAWGQEAVDAALAAQPAPVREGVDLRPAREALVRMRDSGIQDVDQWASSLGPDLARAGEAEFSAPPVPEPVAPEAGDTDSRKEVMRNGSDDQGSVTSPRSECDTRGGAPPAGEEIDAIGRKAREMCAAVCTDANGEPVNEPCGECTAHQEHDWRADAREELARSPAPPVSEPVVQPAVEAPCHWGGGNDVIWCSTCGEEYAYAKGETQPPCPRTAPPAGEDLAALSAAATPGRLFAAGSVEFRRGPDDAEWYISDGKGNLSGCDVSKQDAQFWAALVNAYRAGKLLPAPTQPAVQGEPVAWAWEWLDDADSWNLAYAEERPEADGHTDLRNIRPLYEAPQPAATGRPSVEEVAALIRAAMFSDRDIQWMPFGKRVAAMREVSEDIASKIIALLAPDRGDER